MTSEFLKSYISKKEEIKELTYKLEHLADGDTLIGNDVIYDYRSGYPVAQSVVGVDRGKYYRLSNLYYDKRERLQDECRQIEEFVENIPDSLTRRIFRMYYIDGFTQRQIANEISVDRSTVTKKIYRFLKVSPNSPNSPL